MLLSYIYIYVIIIYIYKYIIIIYYKYVLYMYILSILFFDSTLETPRFSNESCHVQGPVCWFHQTRVLCHVTTYENSDPA